MVERTTDRDPAKILGSARYNLRRIGRVSLADMIDGNGEPLAMDDLRFFRHVSLTPYSS
jgi:hypothetical protein